MTAMTEGKAILSIIVGCAAIASSFLINQFYAGRILRRTYKCIRQLYSALERPANLFHRRDSFCPGGTEFLSLPPMKCGIPPFAKNAKDGAPDR